MTFDISLKIVSTLSIIIPTILCVWRYKSLHRFYLPLQIYLYITALVESYGLYTIIAWVFFKKPVHNTMPIYNLLTIVEGVCLCLLYRNFYVNNRLRQMTIVLLIFFVGYALYEYQKDPKEWNNFSMAVESLLILLMALFFFFQLLGSQESITQAPMFWITTGILLYFAGGFFVFLFSSFLMNPKNYAQYGWIWNINHYVNIPYHLLVAYGIWLVPHRFPKNSFTA